MRMILILTAALGVTSCYWEIPEVFYLDYEDAREMAVQAWEETNGEIHDDCIEYFSSYEVVEFARGDTSVCRTAIDVDGCHSWDERRIGLADDLTELELADSLIHEWIHAIAWCEHGDADRDHLRADLWDIKDDTSMLNRGLTALVDNTLGE